MTFKPPPSIRVQVDIDWSPDIANRLQSEGRNRELSAETARALGLEPSRLWVIDRLELRPGDRITGLFFTNR